MGKPADNISLDKLKAAIRYNFRTIKETGIPIFLRKEGENVEVPLNEREFFNTQLRHALDESNFALQLIQAYNKASYTEEDLENAIQLRLIQYFADLRHYVDGKPDPDPILTFMREDCKQNPDKMRQLIQDYREAVENGIAIDDQDGHVKELSQDSRIYGGLDGWLARIRVVNTFEMPPNLSERQQQIRQSGVAAKFIQEKMRAEAAQSPSYSNDRSGFVGGSRVQSRVDASRNDRYGDSQHRFGVSHRPSEAFTKNGNSAASCRPAESFQSNEQSRYDIAKGSVNNPNSTTNGRKPWDR